MGPIPEEVRRQEGLKLERPRSKPQASSPQRNRIRALLLHGSSCVLNGKHQLAVSEVVPQSEWV